MSHDGPRPERTREELENEGELAADYLETLLDIADLSGDLEVDIENDGFIPTALRQAQLVKIVRPDTLTLEFPDGVSTSGGGRGGRGGRGRRGGGRRGGGTTPPAQGTGVQILSSRSIDLDRILGNETKTLTFKVRLNQMTGTAATLRYSSTRGGVVTRELHIGN